MAKIKKIQESGETIYPATIFQAVKDPQSGQTLEKSFESEHKKLTAGFAYEVLGDGQATNEKFSFRPTGGPNRNVRDGSARIEVLKGNSVVWNQLAIIKTWNIVEQEINGIKMTIEGDYLVFNGTATATAVFNLFYVGNIITNHKYFFNPLTNYVDGEWYKYCFYAPNDTWKSVNLTGQPFISEAAITITNQPISFTVWEGVTVSNIRINKNFGLIDLTQMFGAGKEPQRVEDFYEMMPEGVDINAYNEGQIVDANYKSIKTTGFNQYNGTYAKVLGGVKYYLGGTYTSIGYTTEEGGTTEAITIPSDKFYTPSQNGYIYAEGNDICINIAWDEYSALNGTYKPYKPFERDLSWANKYFPATINGETKYGMRSAGNVADEIRFNSTTQQWEAVRKVGIVDLGSLTWTTDAVGDKIGFICRKSVVIPPKDIYSEPNMLCAPFVTVVQAGNGSYLNDKVIFANVNGWLLVSAWEFNGDASAFKNAMAGVMLNYELATPIVTPITEDINFAYDVADYGTEQLIVAEGAQSAPLSAKVVYEPNVLASIKQVATMLTRLDALETAVATMQASAVATTNEE